MPAEPAQVHGGIKECSTVAGKARNKACEATFPITGDSTTSSASPEPARSWEECPTHSRLDVSGLEAPLSTPRKAKQSTQQPPQSCRRGAGPPHSPFPAWHQHGHSTRDRTHPEPVHQGLLSRESQTPRPLSSGLPRKGRCPGGAGEGRLPGAQQSCGTGHPLPT